MTNYPTPDASTPVPGRLLGDRYQLQSKLGEGGMGMVFKGTDIRLNRVVAVKLLNPEIVNDERSVLRFKQEMATTSALAHPHLIGITDVGFSSDNLPFYVMEYLEGRSLDEELDDGSLDAARTVKIAYQIADVLGYAHSKGIVHRDLKPGNVMLIGDRDFVKVFDLGIAKLITQETAQRLTRTGEVFGSPLYMSPEQCLGETIDGRSDIYSLGCMMFEMLSNSYAICGSSSMDTLMKHIQDDPRKLADVPQLIMTPQVVALDKLIQRCLRKNPDERPASMADIKRELERIGGDQSQSPGVPEPDDSFERTVLTKPVTDYSKAEVRLSKGQEKPPSKNQSEKNFHPKIEREPQGTTSGDLQRPSRDVRRKAVAQPPDEEESSAAGLPLKVILACGVAVIIVGAAATVFALSQFSQHQPKTTHSHKKKKNEVVRAPANDELALPGPKGEELDDPGASTTEANLKEAHSDGVLLSQDENPKRVYLVAEMRGHRSERRNDPFSHTTVMVGDTEKPVVLVLSSFYPVSWRVEKADDVHLEKVIANGYAPVQVDAPVGVEVVKNWDAAAPESAKLKPPTPSPFKLFVLTNFGDVVHSELWSATDTTIKYLTGQPVYKFWGRYTGSGFDVR